MAKLGAEALLAMKLEAKNQPFYKPLHGARAPVAASRQRGRLPSGKLRSPRERKPPFHVPSVCHASAANNYSRLPEFMETIGTVMHFSCRDENRPRYMETSTKLLI